MGVYERPEHKESHRKGFPIRLMSVVASKDSDDQHLKQGRLRVLCCQKVLSFSESVRAAKETRPTMKEGDFINPSSI